MKKKSRKNDFLSYILDEETPTYGNRSRFIIEKSSSIRNGDVANNSCLYSTAHIGTHVDMPYHFYEHGQKIIDFPPDFWIFNNVLFLEIEPRNIIIKNEIIDKLCDIEDKDIFDILILKTGACYIRKEKRFWENNYGFSPEIADYLKNHFPNIRLVGFDSISVSSFAARDVGRQAHRRFLDPDDPIILLEDMDLTQVDSSCNINKVIVCPLRIAESDGLPCTVFAEVLDDN